MIIYLKTTIFIDIRLKLRKIIFLVYFNVLICRSSMIKKYYTDIYIFTTFYDVV